MEKYADLAITAVVQLGILLVFLGSVKSDLHHLKATQRHHGESLQETRDIALELRGRVNAVLGQPYEQ